MISFIIRPDEVSSNKFYKGIHWGTRKKIADYYHLIVKQALNNKMVMFTKPVEIIMYFNNCYDLCNQGMMYKMIIDGFKGVLIKDDSRKYFQKARQEFWDGDGIKVEIREINNEI